MSKGERSPDSAQKAESGVRGRSSKSNTTGRFEKLRNERFDDGWEAAPEDRPNRVDTTLTAETAKVILSRNESPDIGFDRSINPYRGCEHGCIYCFARPTHAYIGLSPGLDFETKLYFKPNAAELLRNELSKRDYVPDRVQLGANTDCYQPIERAGLSVMFRNGSTTDLSQESLPLGLLSADGGLCCLRGRVAYGSQKAASPVGI